MYLARGRHQAWFFAAVLSRDDKQLEFVPTVNVDLSHSSPEPEQQVVISREFKELVVEPILKVSV